MLIIPVASSSSIDGRTADDIPISQQVEGLDPVPRIAYLRHLISEGRRDSEVLFQLAVAFHELGESDSALAYYDETIRVEPDHFKSYVNRGVLLDDAGNVAAAVASFLTAVEISPDDVLAHSHLAFLLLEKESYQHSWMHLSKALDIDPEHPQPRFYLAIFFWEAGIYREAIREWERVIELEPEGFLAGKARENIVMLQRIMNESSPSSGWEPAR
jgi:tetratricopeptide (TPR) repeat protein